MGISKWPKKSQMSLRDINTGKETHLKTKFDIGQEEALLNWRPAGSSWVTIWTMTQSGVAYDGKHE